MKNLLVIITIITLFGCEKVAPGTYMFPRNKKEDVVTQPIPPTINPTNPKVGFVIDTNWFKRQFPGYWIETHNWNGGGDFNNDGRKDLVVMFATNSPADYLHQKDDSSRIVAGVFINHKTYFELDTNLVYSYLGGWSGVNVSDIDNDGFLDIYQMTGYWKAFTKQKPNYYNNSGHGGMDSYLFMNNKNKSFKRYTIPVRDNSGSTTSIISDNNKVGYKEIYSSSCICYYEFNGVSVDEKPLNLIKTFKGLSYNLRVITPKYADSKIGIIYTAQSGFSDTYFILKVDGNNIVPIIKYEVPYLMSAPAQEIYVEDLNKDGKYEYIIPNEIPNSNDKPAIPYLMIVDENGNDVSKTFMDEEITKPLSYEQINWVGENWQTGFIYHTFTDIDNDGIREIFPASGVGYKKGNDTYYYKLIGGKYKLQFYHSGWLGDVHKSKGYINYIPFVDEKNGVNVFLPVEKNLLNAIFKTF